MADTIREKICQALVAAGETITASNGYDYTLTSSVHRAKRNPDPDNLPALSIFDGRESSERLMTANVAAMDVALEFHNTLDQDANASAVGNLMLGNLRKAFEKRQATLSALIEGIDYVSGEIVFPSPDSLSLTVVATYRVTYRTVKGDPYTQA